MVHFLDDLDLNRSQRLELFEVAWEAKHKKSLDVTTQASLPLLGKQVALMMTKPSLRTRVSFTVAVRRLGGDVIEVGPQNTKLGGGEEIQEWATVLGTMVDAIVARVDHHHTLEALRNYASVPVINGLSDCLHPCQGLADTFTVWEQARLSGEANSATASEFYERDHQWAWIGDGSNVAHSLMLNCASLGIKLRLACPPGHGVDSEILRRARGIHIEGEDGIQVYDDPDQAVAGVSVVYTDTWISMGEEQQKGGSNTRQTQAVFANYQVDACRMAKAAPRAIFMHCLPAQPGQEVSEDILRGSSSRVIAEAENRLWTSKALLSHYIFRSTSSHHQNDADVSSVLRSAHLNHCSSRNSK